SLRHASPRRSRCACAPAPEPGKRRADNACGDVRVFFAIVRTGDPTAADRCGRVEGQQVNAQEGFAMDPLSEVLSLLKPRSTLSAGFDAGGEWSIQFPDQQKRIKCYAVVSGGCWLSVDGVPDAVRLSAGDCFVLPSGRP